MFEIATLIQHVAISSISVSRRAQSAAVHCGAVIFVGSVRTRDLYKRPCEEGALSERDTMSNERKYL